MKAGTEITTPIGIITILQNEKGICGVCFGKSKEGFEKKSTPLLEEASKQLSEYFEGKRQTFNLPLAPEGTEFQMKVWQALLEIPYGETCTYGEIARRIGCSKGSRAVGMANHHNPIGILIPCHRVIGAGGKLVGYSGGLDKKVFLLKLERNLQL